MARQPRYDVPKAAPEPLRRVQLFVNSVDLHNEVEWLPGWLAERGLGGELERARELREALRSLVLANNGAAPDAAALDVLNRALDRISLELDDSGQLVLADAQTSGGLLIASGSPEVLESAFGARGLHVRRIGSTRVGQAGRIRVTGRVTQE